MKRLIVIISGSLLMLSRASVPSISHNDTVVLKQGFNNVCDQSSQKSKGSSSLTTPVPASWLGKYTAYFSYGDIAGQAAGWELEINITKGKITAKGEGFQMGFVDELKATVSDSKLILTHLKNVSGYTTGKKMSPEFTLTNNKGKFYVKSEWIASADVKEKPTAFGYKIDRVKK